MNRWKSLVITLLICMCPLLADDDEPVVSNIAILTVDDTNFNQILKSNKPVVIDVSASWCGPCKTMAPNFQKAANRIGEICIFAKIDVDVSKALATTRLKVRSIPTLLFFNNGEEVGRVMGAKNESEIVGLVQKYFNIRLPQ